MRRVLTILLAALPTSLLVAGPVEAVPEDKIVVVDPRGDVAGHDPEKSAADVAKVTYRYNIDRDGGVPPRRHLAIDVRFKRALWHRPRSQVVETRLSVGGTRYLVKFTSVGANMWRLENGDREPVGMGMATVESRGEFGKLILRFFPPAFGSPTQVDWFRTTMRLHLPRTEAYDETARTDRPLLTPFPD